MMVSGSKSLEDSFWRLVRKWILEPHVFCLFVENIAADGLLLRICEVKRVHFEGKLGPLKVSFDFFLNLFMIFP